MKEGLLRFSFPIVKATMKINLLFGLIRSLHRQQLSLLEESLSLFALRILLHVTFLAHSHLLINIIRRHVVFEVRAVPTEESM